MVEVKRKGEGRAKLIMNKGKNNNKNYTMKTSIHYIVTFMHLPKMYIHVSVYIKKWIIIDCAILRYKYQVVGNKFDKYNYILLKIYNPHLLFCRFCSRFCSKHYRTEGVCVCVCIYTLHIYYSINMDYI